jgi:single-stranded DNA-binding protein
MSIRGNRVFLAGEIVKVGCTEKIARVDLSLPTLEGESEDKRPTIVGVYFRNEGDVNMVELASQMKAGDLLICEAQFYQQPMKLDNKEKDYRIMGLEAKPGKVIHVPDQGVAARAAGGGINCAIFAGAIVRDPELIKVGDKGTPKITISIACEPRYNREQSPEERKAATVYMDFVGWRGLAEKFLSRAKKSDQFVVVGAVKAEIRKDLIYKTKPVSVMTITPDGNADISFESPAPRGGNGGGGGNSNRGGNNNRPSVDDDLPF